MANALFSSYVDYILGDAVWSSNVAPMTSYSVDTFEEINPAKRVRWNVKNVTITATKAGAAQRGDVAVGTELDRALHQHPLERAPRLDDELRALRRREAVASRGRFVDQLPGLHLGLGVRLL